MMRLFLGVSVACLVSVSIVADEAFSQGFFGIDNEDIGFGNTNSSGVVGNNNTNSSGVVGNDNDTTNNTLGNDNDATINTVGNNNMTGTQRSSETL